MLARIPGHINPWADPKEFATSGRRPRWQAEATADPAFAVLKLSKS
jgi:hypothetical protein